MKVAPKIVFLFKDPDGFGPAIADALHPNPNPHSSLRRLEESFELSLGCYGIKDHKACGNLFHFIDHGGDYQVSVLLLENYEPPTLACAINEVLTQLMGQQPFGLPTLIVPFILASSKLKLGSRTLTTNGVLASLYGVQIGPETDIHQAIATKTEKLPSSLQIHCEPLSCFIQLVRVLRLPTSVLIGQIGRSHPNKAFEEKHEILCEMGELLANTTCLCFLREKVTLNPAKTSRDSEKPWRALYF